MTEIWVLRTETSLGTKSFFPEHPSLSIKNIRLKKNDGRTDGHGKTKSE